MRRGSWIPLLLAAALVGGCDSSDPSDGDTPKFANLSLFDPVASDPATGTVVPFPFDGLFAGFSDPTLNIPNPAGVPFVTAANLTDGFSTTASMFTDLLGFVDYTTAAQAIVLINTATGQRLAAGVDYTVQSSPALAAVSGSDPPVLLPIDQQRSRLLIEPLRPLAPSTRYLVAVTTDLRSLDGLPARASELFKIAASATPVSEQSNLVLGILSPTQLATLETLRQQLIRPAVMAVEQLTDYDADDLVIAWTFTTQSTTKSLLALEAAAVAAPIGAAPTGLSTGDLGLGLADSADIYAGTFTAPYYLANSGGSAQSTAPLTGFWLADATQPDLTASFLGQVPCGAFAAGAPLPGGLTAAPSVSTTTCFPLPVKRSDETLPLLVAVPNGASGRAQPAAGWPVVIFQHGITGNRTQALAIAPALAAAGFVTVAIDLPLHGLPPDDPSRLPGVGERTFDLDLVNNATSAPGPDGTADSSGTHFINLSSVITSRDNLRQATSDLIHLVKSVGALDLDGDPLTDDVDESRVHFVGMSLGAMVGTPLLGVNDDIVAASLAVPAGGIARTLDASKTFGPRIAAGLAAGGVTEGTDSYESFLRFAQHLVDPADPINFAVAAREKHPIHMIEVVDDLVIPNAAPASPGTAVLDRVTITGFLSGTEALYALMGLEVIGPLDVPVAAQTPRVDVDGLGIVTVFNQSNHSSLLSPAASLDATLEMQRQVANFIASDGKCLPVGGSCQ